LNPPIQSSFYVNHFKVIYKDYDHISFLRPHKRCEIHVHMKLSYDKERLRNEQGERVQDEHVDHAV
jgi:hypothetical protein